MLIFSHRGYHVNTPENTLEAFEQAVAMGVDGIETDVRLSADALPVLFHDRLAPDGRDVASMSRQELSELVGYSVPTLDLALERWKDVIWNIEIKTPMAVDATLSVLNRYYRSRRCLVTSFRHDVVDQVSRRIDVQCGILVAHCPAGNVQLLNLLPHERIRTIVWSYEFVDPTLLQQAAAHGFTSFVYGLETENEHRRCLQMAVDGIITDHPEILIDRTPSLRARRPCL